MVMSVLTCVVYPALLYGLSAILHVSHRGGRLAHTFEDKVDARLYDLSACRIAHGIYWTLAAAKRDLTSPSIFGHWPVENFGLLMFRAISRGVLLTSAVGVAILAAPSFYISLAVTYQPRAIP